MAGVRQDHVINSGSVLGNRGPGCDYPTDPRTGLSESMASPLRSGPNVGRLAERSTNLGARPLPNQSGDSVNDEGPGRLSVRHTESCPRGSKFTRPAWALVGSADLSSFGNRCRGRFTCRRVGSDRAFRPDRCVNGALPSAFRGSRSAVRPNRWLQPS